MERGKYFLSNRKVRTYLDAVSDVGGRYGFEAVLQLAGLHQWIRQLPPYNDAQEVDYVDFAALSTTMVRMYGWGGGRTLALRAGRALFLALSEQIAAVLHTEDSVFWAQLPAARVSALLEAIVEEENRSWNGHVSLRMAGEQFLYTVEPCPVCWGSRDSEDVQCFSTVGFLQQAIEWVGAGDHYIVEEASCAATKTGQDAACVFAVLRVD